MASWWCAVALVALVLLGGVVFRGPRLGGGAARPCEEVYLVGEGETLHTINDKCGDPFIVERNQHVHDPDDVFPGLVIALNQPSGVGEQEFLCSALLRCAPMWKIMMFTERSLFRCAYEKPSIVLTVDSGGELSLLWLQTERLEVEIWKRQDRNEIVHDDDDNIWHCTRVVVQKQPNKSEIQGIRELYILGEKCSTILVKDGHQRVYIAHLESGLMEEVTKWLCSYLGFGEPVLFEPDWPALFVSRLGSR